MADSQTTQWTTFRHLCQILGGQDTHALELSINAGLLEDIFEFARFQGLLPALAIRFEERKPGKLLLDDEKNEELKKALRDNTLRNMQISAQAIKIARALNQVEIKPLFLKGTAYLLTSKDRQLGFRKQIDIDLIVEPARLKEASAALLKDGYSFYPEIPNSRASPTKPINTDRAIRLSRAHHHLPPMVKNSCVATVELHRHFLPRRFQGANPLPALFGTALEKMSYDAHYLVPSTEYQLIHLVLGKLVHDGYLLGRKFPIREGCDYIDLVAQHDGKLDTSLIEGRCGNNYAIFERLVSELMRFEAVKRSGKTINVSRRLSIMKTRYQSPTTKKLLDAYARTTHLGNSLLHSPAKLPEYLKRLSSNQN